MTEQVQKWLNEFYKMHNIPMQEMLHNMKCDGCGVGLDNSFDTIWHGGNIKLHGFYICPDCKTDRDKPLIVQNKYCMHNSCNILNLTEGWFIENNTNNILCMGHYNETKSRKFKHVSKKDLIEIDTSETNTVYYDPEGKGAGFICNTDILLTFPKCITNKRYIEVATQWFGLHEQKEEEVSELIRGQKVNSPWTDLVRINGEFLNVHNKFIVSNSQFSNIAEWVPFDMIDTVSEFAIYGAYVIVNCNPESSYYLAIATVVFDNQFRVSVDIVNNLTIHNYLIFRNKYNINASLEEPIHIDVRCDGCNMSPIIGVRWACQECDNFDLCDKCHGEKGHSRKGRVHQMNVEKALEIHYIENLRIGSGQGFYFG